MDRVKGDRFGFAPAFDLAMATSTGVRINRAGRRAMEGFVVLDVVYVVGTIALFVLIGAIGKAVGKL